MQLRWKRLSSSIQARPKQPRWRPSVFLFGAYKRINCIKNSIWKMAYRLLHEINVKVTYEEAIMFDWDFYSTKRGFVPFSQKWPPWKLNYKTWGRGSCDTWRRKQNLKMNLEKRELCSKTYLWVKKVRDCLLCSRLNLNSCCTSLSHCAGKKNVPCLPQMQNTSPQLCTEHYLKCAMFKQKKQQTLAVYQANRQLIYFHISCTVRRLIPALFLPFLSVMPQDIDVN